MTMRCDVAKNLVPMSVVSAADNNLNINLMHMYIYMCTQDSRLTPFHLLPKIEFMKIKSLKLSHSVSLFSVFSVYVLCRIYSYRSRPNSLVQYYYGMCVCVFFPSLSSLIRYCATGWCYCYCVAVHCFYVLDFLIRGSLLLML